MRWIQLLKGFTLRPLSNTERSSLDPALVHRQALASITSCVNYDTINGDFVTIRTGLHWFWPCPTWPGQLAAVWAPGLSVYMCVRLQLRRWGSHPSALLWAGSTPIPVHLLLNPG